MEITTIKDNQKLTLALKGRLDTVTAPDLESEINNNSLGIKSLIFDFDNLEYISSAGLRILIAAQKMMNKSNGEMAVINVNETVNEVFEITGFADILTITTK